MRTLANWPLRAKLLAVLALPVLAAVLLAALRVYDGFSDSAIYQRSVERIQLDQTVATAVDDVQDERASMVAWIVAGRPPARGNLDSQVRRTDASAAAFVDAQDLVDDIDDPSVTALYAQARTRVDVLGQLRINAASPDFDSDAAFNTYGEVVDSLLAITDEADIAVTDRGLSDRQEALRALAHAKEAAAERDSYLLNAATRNSFTLGEQQGIADAGANLVSAIDTFNGHSDETDQRIYTNTMAGPEIADENQIQQLAADRARNKQPVDIPAAEVAKDSAVNLDRFRTVEKQVQGNALGYAKNLCLLARRDLIITASSLLAGLLVALTVTYLVSRILLRQLRTLRGTALAVADEQLPSALTRIMDSPDPIAASNDAIDPVPVDTTEEIGQVARAFDQVHGQAIRLAAEQALLRDNINGILVNLSRRSQVLVQRQLSVIDRLEDQEQDPDRLTDLFELDHLTTRLRRNGESLLVLSGSTTGHTVSRPTRVADIVGAAVSETQEYVRVDVGALPDVSVRGPAVHDLVHLLAELLDNATFFSERTTAVQVRAALSVRGDLDVRITDHGVGMTDEHLRVANANLADPPDLDVSVTRRMGLYVVARLSERHGILVRLLDNEGEGGVSAAVTVPADLLIDQAGASATLPPQVSVKQLPSGSRARVRETGSGAADGDPGGVRRAMPRQRSGIGMFAPEPAEDDTVVLSAPVTRAEPVLPALERPVSLDSLVGDGPARALEVEQVSGLLTRQPPADPPADGAPPAGEPSEGDQPTTGSTVDGFDGDRLPANGSHSNGLHSNGAHANGVPANGVPVDGFLDDPFPDEPVPTDSLPAPPRRPSPGAARHEELVRKGTPIYQEMMSHWLSEAPADAVPADAAHAVWRDPSDVGWEAASGLGDQRDEPRTAAGLPKRVPNAHLVPGSVDVPEHAELPDEATAAHRARDARERMARFQRGFLAGRHTLGAPQHQATSSAVTSDFFTRVVADRLPATTPDDGGRPYGDTRADRADEE